jgi:Integrase zinc binding domain
MNVTVLLDSIFVHAITLSTLEDYILGAQVDHQDLLEHWQTLHPHMHLHDGHWFYNHLPIVMEDNALRWEVLTQCHDHPLAGHPRIFNTLHLVRRDYWWLDIKQFVKNYIQGCATC